ncbi:hypothetical protein [Lacisediminihabitans changchengi]|uniref:Uncharacterized protein n=1 Tax=Lacisediminihabitans changchengi TaxID=2787634 RepID=A0A934STV9_9MICO|nr:hypothetical protein [Lacisediminihabitans changchengi]MBK4348845.1 hypothetical protein [Lacisediminihabitans changchengi]
MTSDGATVPRPRTARPAPKPPSRILLLAIAAIIVSIVVGLIVHGVTRPGPVPPITSISFSQFEAVPGFDDSTFVERSPERIAELEKVAAKYDVPLNDVGTTHNDPCSGGLGTDVTLTFRGAGRSSFHLNSCTGPNGSGTFVADATALFSQWRTSGS